jgi:hypothetical protein
MAADIVMKINIVRNQAAKLVTGPYFLITFSRPVYGHISERSVSKEICGRLAMRKSPASCLQSLQGPSSGRKHD